MVIKLDEIMQRTPCPVP